MIRSPTLLPVALSSCWSPVSQFAAGSSEKFLPIPFFFSSLLFFFGVFGVFGGDFFPSQHMPAAAAGTAAKEDAMRGHVDRQESMAKAMLKEVRRRHGLRPKTLAADKGFRDPLV